MKNKILVADTHNNKLHFYLVSAGKRYYLFTQKYTQGVYEFFSKGRAEQEVLSFKHWNHNPRLDKTIEKIPLYTAYVLREVG